MVSLTFPAPVTKHIASQLYPLSKAAPKWYKNKYPMQLVENAVDSKLAILAQNGSMLESGRDIYYAIDKSGTLYTYDYAVGGLVVIDEDVEVYNERLEPISFDPGKAISEYVFD